MLSQLIATRLTLVTLQAQRSNIGVRWRKLRSWPAWPSPGHPSHGGHWVAWWRIGGRLQRRRPAAHSRYWRGCTAVQLHVRTWRASAVTGLTLRRSAGAGRPPIGCYCSPAVGPGTEPLQAEIRTVVGLHRAPAQVPGRRKLRACPAAETVGRSSRSDSTRSSGPALGRVTWAGGGRTRRSALCM